VEEILRKSSIKVIIWLLLAAISQAYSEQKAEQKDLKNFQFGQKYLHVKLRLGRYGF
jgi:hypothetical protein